jgi:Na+-transporting NADH:ubiquinone oxidoreductase subunit A
MTRHIRIKKGLDIPMRGVPEQSVLGGNRVRHVALCGIDFIGLKPRLLVSKGDAVGLGQPLFIDKRDPDVMFCSPGRGTVVAVNRGVRRVLESVVVRLGDSGAGDVNFSPLSDDRIGKADRSQLAERLYRSGLWTAFRTRPFNRIPQSGTAPRSIFVTAIDTRPLAADPRVLIGRDQASFASGLQVLSRLSEGPVFLCVAPGWDQETGAPKNVEIVEFSGPHPSGLPGTHIHYLDPVGAGRTVWQVGYQDVMAVGKLFRKGVIDTGRVVALGGDPLNQPRLVESRMGAALDELLENEVRKPEECRVVSGSVLGGRTAAGSLAFLGRYHDQVSVLPEGGDRRLFGWMGLISGRFSAASTFMRPDGRKRPRSFTTAQNGRFSGMLPMRVFERVMPLDILPSPLFRAMMVQDTDQAQALGCLELDEEDLALSSFVCPAKNDYGAALRVNLEKIEREG